MRRTIVATIICALFSFTHDAAASGFRLMEIDNVGQGMAHARVAGVDDAAAVYYNPAAMPEIEKYSAKAGFQYVDPKTKLDHATGPEETVNETLPVPHLYSVSKMEDMGLSFGMGVFSNFGQAVSWEIDSPLRHVATDTKLKTYTVNASAAMSLELLSIGVGVNYMTVHAEYDNIHSYTGLGGDGYSLVDVDGSTVGFNVGLLMKLTDAIKIGATYRSAMTADLSGRVDMENIPGYNNTAHRARILAGQASAAAPPSGGGDSGPGSTKDDYKSDVDTSFNFPAIASAGININVTDAFSVEFDVDYTQWSAFDEITFKFASPLSLEGHEVLPNSVTYVQNWEDTTTLKIGAAFKIDPQMTFRCGFIVDPSPVPDDTFSPRTPDADRNVVTVGFGYRASDNYTVDASFAYIMMGDRDVSNNVGAPNDDVSGTYSTTANIFGVSVGYTF